MIATVVAWLGGLIRGVLRILFAGVSSWWAGRSATTKTVVKILLSVAAIGALTLAIISHEEHGIAQKIKAAYDTGYRAGVTKDQEDRKVELNRLQAEANLRVATIQKVADASANKALKTTTELGVRLQDSEARLNTLRNKLNTAVYDAEGNTLICYKYKAATSSDKVTLRPEIEIRLGKDFSEEWNKINDEVNQSVGQSK